MTRHAVSGLVLLAALLCATMTATTQGRFPNGPGKNELIKVCSGCHEPEMVFAFSKTVPEWSETLKMMVQLGTEATDEEWRLIEQYIDANIALIPINVAAASELQRTMDVPQTVAEAIAKYRQEHGAFKSVEDVKKVPGLEAGKVEARKERLIF